MTKIDNKIWREIKKEIKYDDLDIHNDSPFVSKSGAGKKVLSKYRVTVPSFHTDFIVAENEEEALNKFLDSVGGVTEAEYVEYDFDENDPSLDAIWYAREKRLAYRITVIEVTWHHSSQSFTDNLDWKEEAEQWGGDR